MKRFLCLLAVTGLCLTNLYAQTTGRQKHRRQVVIDPANLPAPDSTAQSDPAHTTQVNINSENKPGFHGEYELNGKKYSYAVTPADQNGSRYNVIIKSFIQEEDFGNWKQLYNGLIIIEDLESTRKLYKIKLYHFKNTGYSWTPSVGAFLEANFNLKVRKVAYRTVADMKPAMGNSKDKIVSLGNEDLNSSRMMDYVIRYFTEHYQEN